MAIKEEECHKGQGLKSSGEVQFKGKYKAPSITSKWRTTPGPRILIIAQQQLLLPNLLQVKMHVENEII